MLENFANLVTSFKTPPVFFSLFIDSITELNISREKILDLVLV
jgi:hypothetical protein